MSIVRKLPEQHLSFKFIRVFFLSQNKFKDKKHYPKKLIDIDIVLWEKHKVRLEHIK